MSDVAFDFSPSLIHPFYFNRNGLKNGILEFSSVLRGKMMDFGCGSKPYKNLFSVDEYIGVDFVNEGHSHENEEIDIYYDGKIIPIQDEYFDSVLSSEVFEHIFNLNEILAEINRVMKPGGNLLFTCPFVWNEHEVPHDYARYSLFALSDILQKNGFEIVGSKKAGNFIIAICQLCNLYWYTIFHKKKNRFVLTRWVYKLFLILPTNILGKVLNKVLPTNDSLYLNNVILAKKL